MYDFGNYQNMPDYRGDWQNPHESGVARLGRMADPTSYMISAVGGQNAPQVHDIGERVADYSNQALSPVVGATMPIFEALSPEIKQINKLTGSTGQGLRNFVKNKPVDTAAILAASFFGAGAAGAGGGSLGAGGDAAATNAISPALASVGGGAGTSAASGLGPSGAIAATNAITPTLASVGGAGASSAPGLLGASGTAALEAAIPSTYSTLAASTPSSLSSLLNTFQSAIKPLKTAKKYTDMAQDLYRFVPKDNSGQANLDAQNRLAQGILDSNGQGVNKVSEAMANMRRY